VTVTEKQLGHWRTLPPRVALPRFVAAWLAETGGLPTTSDIARALALSRHQVDHYQTYPIGVPRRAKRPARQYGRYVKAATSSTRPLNLTRLHQAQAAFPHA